MKRLPSRKRRLIALVVALLALSALLGDTSTTRSAGAEPMPVLAFGPSACGSSTFIPWFAGDGAERAAALRALVQRGPGTSARAMAGVPPWTIWPPAPVPHIVGAVVHSPAARARTVVPLLGTRLASPPEPASILRGGNPVYAAHRSEPVRLPERVAGVDLASPRPPPR